MADHIVQCHQPRRDLLNKLLKTWKVSLKTSIKKLCTPKDASYSAARLHSGAPNGSVPQNICSSGQFLLGDVEEIICPWKESVAKKKMCLRAFDV